MSLEAYENARSVFKRADQHFKKEQMAEERLLIIENWHEFEKQHGSEETISSVGKMLPERVLRKRPLSEAAEEGGFEEYVSYVFPDDESRASGAQSILAAAKRWKRQKVAADQ